MLTPPTTPPSPSGAATDISVLITGGVGFLGSFIVDAVLEKHPTWSLVVLDQRSPLAVDPRVKYQVGDVRDEAQIEEIVRKFHPNVIIHSAGLVPELAARYTREQENLVYNVNVDGTRNMLGVARSVGAKAFVWTGSCTAVTDVMRYQYANIDERWPTSSHSLIYGESKVGIRHQDGKV